MSIQTKVVTVEETRVVSITCSKCKKVVTPDDFIEWQEFFVYTGCGGYGSVFGDGTKYRIDLCQSCMFKLIGGYAEDIDEED